MNFLAHFFLAGQVAAPTDELMLGNFAADFVRGNPKAGFAGFSPEMVHGVRLHRVIDDFTDHHAVPRESANRLRAEFGRYAPVLVDIIYDHFLARAWLAFTPEPLSDFAERMYATLGRHTTSLPLAVQQFLPHMIQHNWLVNYATDYGLERSLASVSRRARYGTGFEAAVHTVRAHDAAFMEEFMTFFPDIIRVVANFS
jgi:acyl carrier protein phosphodiesterase